MVKKVKNGKKGLKMVKKVKNGKKGKKWKKRFKNGKKSKKWINIREWLAFLRLLLPHLAKCAKRARITI